MYEGYAPGGVALLIECLTDNRNRAASDVRVAFTRNGGTLADPGSVSYLFSRKGVVSCRRGRRDRGRRAGGGARRRRRGGQRPRGGLRGDQRGDRRGGRAHGAAGRRDRLRLRGGPVRPRDCRSSWTSTGARKIIRLIDALEDSDDVQNVYTNFDVSDEVHGRARRRGVSRRRGCAPPNVRSAPVRLDRMRVLGVDPGLTRCGLGVVEAAAGRVPSWWRSGVRPVRRRRRRGARRLAAIGADGSSAGSISTSPTPSRSSGSSPSTTSAR